MECPKRLTTRGMVALLSIISWISYCYLCKQDNALDEERTDKRKLRPFLDRDYVPDIAADGSASAIHPRGTYDEDFWTELRAAATSERLYSPETDVSRITSALSSAKIVGVRLFTPDHVPESEQLGDFGSTHKWLVELEGGQKAVFKPKWYPRNHTKQFWSDGFELHTSEIISYHLDRLLGFHRVPYTSGRYIDIASEVLRHSSQYMGDVISYNGKEYCIRDKCYFCEDNLVTCTADGKLEGAIIYYISNLSLPVDNPWGVKYSHRHLLKGFNNLTYCQEIRARNPYLLDQSTFLDLVDLSILDHLSYHYDSKLYWIQSGPAQGLMIYLDRGRSFTKFDLVDDRNLLPLWQCCRLRRATWRTLLFLNKNGNMETGLKRLLSADALYPPSLLADGHYDAISQRLRHILSVTERCMAANGASDVIISA